MWVVDYLACCLWQVVEVAGVVVAEGVADRGEDQEGHVVRRHAGRWTTDALDAVHQQRNQLFSYRLRTVAASTLHKLFYGTV